VSGGGLPPYHLDRTVWVTHRFTGWHAWPGAPHGRKYLASPHRHVFHVRAEVEVEKDDREIEFHDLLDVVDDACRAMGSHLGSKSCEMIAAEIGFVILKHWPGRKVAVDVAEDGENGACVVLSSLLP
jgi:hypothetical protein